MTLDPADVVKVLLAVAVGGAVGFEREFHDKAAGFRTLIFICLGAALFTMLSLRLGHETGDPTRIAADVVAGVGFIGAGVILREGGRVIGLTTAATVWLVAALGMAVGAAEHALAVFMTVVALAVLWVFPVFERWVDHLYNERTYHVSWTLPVGKAPQLEAAIRGEKLRVVRRGQTRLGDRVTWTATLTGRLASHQRLETQLLADREIDEVRF